MTLVLFEFNFGKRTNHILTLNTSGKTQFGGTMKNQILNLILIVPMLFLFNCKTLTSVKIEKEKYSIIQESNGDLNLDGINDLAILVSTSNSEKATIIIFILDFNGNVSKKLVNENLTDVFVEMYQTLPEIEMNNGKLILSYYGGMCHRESRNLIFTFSKELNDLFFNVIEISEHNVCNDNEPSGYEITSPELRKTKFTNYRDEL